MSKRLYIMKGLPASGKSTRAKEMLAEFGPGNAKRVSKDDLRAMLDNGHWTRNNETFVLQVQDMILSAILDSGLHAIADNTNLAPAREARLKQIAHEHGAIFEIVDFTHVSLDECIARDQKRHGYVGEKVIRQMYNQYLAPKPPVIEYDPKLPYCLIVDVDGTIALMNGRGPYEWGKVDTDIPNKPVISILDNMTNLDKSKEIILVSGRDGCCREQTEKWLRWNAIEYGALFMRPAGDSRDDRIIKQEIYEREIKGKYNVLYVLDDRDRVVEFWRSIGLTCLQVAPGNF